MVSLNIKYVLVSLLLSFSLFSVSQSDVIPLNFEYQYQLEKALLKSKETSFTLQRPFVFADINKYIDVDSILYRNGRDSKIISKLKRPGLWKKIRTEDLIHYKNKNIDIRINPLMDFSTSSFSDQLLSYNTRGIELKGRIGNKLFVASGFYENQAFFPDYYSSFAKSRIVVPGQGRTRAYKDVGFDYASSYAYVSFSPLKRLNFQIGHGKQFFGEGYRSLIMSDNSFNVPYFKITNTYKWFRYTNLLMLYQNVRSGDGSQEVYNRRYGSIIALDFLIGKRLELGLIETIVWNKKDEKSYFPDANYYNPIIFIRPLQYGWDGLQNIAMGLNSKFKLSKSIVLYSQYLYDDKQRNSFQLGFKSYSIAGLPIFMQLEYNRVMPYTYMHSEGQAFVHASQEIAHPLGANFTELVARFSYQWKDFIISYQLNSAKLGTDSLGTNYGQDIFMTYQTPYGNELHQGVLKELTNHTFRLAFLLNPSTNLQLYFQYRSRSSKRLESHKKENFWTMGIKTNLRNLYDDF